MTTGWNLDNSYIRLPNTFFSKTNPTRVSSAKTVIYNEQLANELGLTNIDDDILVGNKLPEGAQPIAQAYAGHQFGHFTMLGDGRAILLGEQLTPKGDRFDIQLKGPGKTPYSRRGDGRAAPGPMLREYIISEAMYALGVPTSRSLAVVATGETVIRETRLQGAILTRIAASHIRVGTFQYAAQWGSEDELRCLADYTIARHYPGIETNENKYLSFLREVIKRQAQLIAKWQHIGFIHGVMNTDNVTISGETIDYGPCAFMNEYDPKTVFSSIDIHGRYAYGNQPQIGGWNLARFAETLLPLISEDQNEAVKMAQEVFAEYEDFFKTYWLQGMMLKLGITNEEENDNQIVTNLLEIMERHKADYTNTFRALTLEKMNDTQMFKSKEFNEWKQMWKERLERQNTSKEESIQLMKDNNPAVIPRNHRVEAALEAAANGDLTVMNELLGVLSKPYAHNEGQEEYTEPPADNACYKTYCGT